MLAALEERKAVLLRSTGSATMCLRTWRARPRASSISWASGRPIGSGAGAHRRRAPAQRSLPSVNPVTTGDLQSGPSAPVERPEPNGPGYGLFSTWFLDFRMATKARPVPADRVADRGVTSLEQTQEGRGGNRVEACDNVGVGEIAESRARREAGGSH